MDVDDLPLGEVARRICLITERQATFWKDTGGWAPDSVSIPMERARLDRLASLSHALKRWIECPVGEDAAGCLILAWANLGALLEGTFKLFLAVYREDYQRDGNAPRRGAGVPKESEKLTLEALKMIFQKSIWTPDSSAEWLTWVTEVQSRRNSLHAFEDKDIGTHGDFLAAVRKYLVFLRELDNSLPYPDGYGVVR